MSDSAAECLRQAFVSLRYIPPFRDENIEPADLLLREHRSADNRRQNRCDRKLSHGAIPRRRRAASVRRKAAPTPNRYFVDCSAS